LFVGGFISYLRNLCLFVHSGVQHILRFCLLFLRRVYPMLPVALDFPFLIAPLVFSNVYSRSSLVESKHTYKQNIADHTL
jgi:hypothetical protein